MTTITIPYLYYTKLNEDDSPKDQHRKFKFEFVQNL